MDTNLQLSGNATDLIWAMGDGTGKHTIGLRMDCGDSGTVYLTAQQARDVIITLKDALSELGG